MALVRVAEKGSGGLRTTRPFRILSLDPGGTTGWAYAEWLPPENYIGGLTEFEQIKVECGEIAPEKHDHHRELWNLLLEYWQRWTYGPPLEIACESFEFRQHLDKDKAKTKVELISKEYIGVVKLFNQIHQGYDDSPLELHFQTASAAKSLIPDKGPQAHLKLQWLGLYTTGSAHINDAHRHWIRRLVIGKKMGAVITDIWAREIEKRT